MKYKYLIFIFLFLFRLTSFAQKDSVSTKNTTDTIPRTPFFSPPRTAAFLSAVIPGAGQVYNKQYWKLPIIYGLGGLFIFTVSNNNKEYKSYDQAYTYRTDDEEDTIDYKYSNLSDNNVKVFRDYHRRKRDVYIIYSSLLYIANIVDAVVGAHLRDYEISDDLTLHIQPTIIPTDKDLYSGFTFQFVLK